MFDGYVGALYVCRLACWGGGGGGGVCDWWGTWIFVILRFQSFAKHFSDILMQGKRKVIKR